MPDALCYCHDKQILQDLESLCAKHEIRVKSTIDFLTALDWAKLRPFDCMVFDQHIPETERSKLTEQIWKHDPATPVYVYDPNAALGERASDLVLEGLLPIAAGNARDRISRIFDTLKKSGGRVSEPFQVLVVEDLDSPRDIVCSYIEGFGFGQVDGVSSAKEALAVLTQDPTKYSCVLTDIKMPEVTGKELIEQIRKHPKLQNMPIIVLTAYGTADTLIDCLKAGASGFLVKPPKRQDLLRELGRAMRIAQNLESPRLTGQDEADLLRRIIIDKGL